MYTAAVARKIDIDRGGEGRITNIGNDNNYYFLEKTLSWHMSETNQQTICNLCSIDWLPVTPEPLPVDDTEEFNKHVVETEIKNLNKQNQHLLNKINQSESLRETQSEFIQKLKSQLAELEEKLRWKCCESEKPENCEKVTFKDSNDEILGEGFYQHNRWHGYLNQGRIAVVLSDCTANFWKWKYTKDL